MLVVRRQRLKKISKGAVPAPKKSHQVDCMAVVCKLECMGNCLLQRKKNLC